MDKTHLVSDVRTLNVGIPTLVWHCSVIMNGAEMGDNCYIGAHGLAEDTVTPGNNVTVKSDVLLWGGALAEDDANTTFTSDLPPRTKRYPEILSTMTIRKKAGIAADATIWLMASAGVVATKNVSEYAVAVANVA